MERPTIGAQVTPSEGNTIYFNRDMIKVPEDIPNSVVLHEMGHLVDGATGMNNEFLRKLGDKSKFLKMLVKEWISTEVAREEVVTQRHEEDIFQRTLIENLCSEEQLSIPMTPQGASSMIIGAIRMLCTS